MNCKKISKDIQTPYGKALGDCWSVINYFVNLGIERNEIMRLALWYPKGETKKRVDKLKEVLPLFEDCGMVELGEWTPTVPKIHWTKGYEYPFASTKIQWKPNSSKKICYQFDGRSHKAKNFSSKEIEEEVLDSIGELGYDLIKLGSEKTLQQCVEAAAESEVFIGVDSGMCYLSASVGIPIIFCKNNRDSSIWDTAHSNKHHILVDNHTDLIKSIEEYKENGLKYYFENARNLKFFRKIIKEII
jgi:ADP-heptose:LPS heptosyltransferase